MDIAHDPLQKRFSVTVDGVEAYALYADDCGVFDILTTQVPAKISGRGIAGALMGAAFGYARERGLSFDTAQSCSYAARYLEKHPELKV